MRALFLSCLVSFLGAQAISASPQWDTSGATVPANIPALNTRTAPLVNQSTRGRVGASEGLLIGGFVVKTRTNVLIRGIGPSLGLYGVTSPLTAPEVLLYRRETVGGVPTETLVARNADWTQAVAQTDGPELLENVQASLGAFTLSRTSGDAAIYLQLPAGVYTAQLVGRNGATGVGLLEIYLVPPEIDPFDPAWRVFPTAVTPYINQGLAPVYSSKAEWGVRLHMVESAALTVTYTAADFAAGDLRPGVTLPKTVTYGTDWVIPLRPAVMTGSSGAAPGGAGVDSQGWYDELLAGGKFGKSILVIEGWATNDVTTKLWRRVTLTFTAANSGTYLQEVGLGLIAPDRSVSQGKVIASSTGTFRCDRLLEIVPNAGAAPYFAFWVE